MTDDVLDYGKLIDEAMHRVVKRALEIVQKYGLPKEHHFFVTFRTDFAGVMISDELRYRYPEEMTIVLQHQFWDLEVEEDRFSIVLSFDNVKQNLTVPFQALVSFADPSVKFGLQFHNEPLPALPGATTKNAGKPASLARNLTRDPVPQQSAADGDDEKGGNNVVTLDSFRKNGKK